MGRASRIKRDRRETANFVASLTDSADTWLEHAPDAGEQARIIAAQNKLMEHRAEAASIATDYEGLLRASLEVYRDPRFASLYFDDWVVEHVLATYGEPPVVEDDSDPAFSDYLRTAVLGVANSRVRRAIASQSRRFLPQLVIEENNIKAGLIIEHNAYLTVMSDASTPLLVQMMVGALARWYDEHEEDVEEEATADAAEDVSS